MIVICHNIKAEAASLIIKLITFPYFSAPEYLILNKNLITLTNNNQKIKSLNKKHEFLLNYILSISL